MLLQTLFAWKNRLRSWGYEPVFCSVETKNGLDSLAFYLRDQTTVIVGPSGVGKSSLINVLRSDHRASDSLGDNLFDPVGLFPYSLILHFHFSFELRMLSVDYILIILGGVARVESDEYYTYVHVCMFILLFFGGRGLNYTGSHPTKVFFFLVTQLFNFIFFCPQLTNNGNF